jgi:type I restriction enzyme S subunit
VISRDSINGAFPIKRLGEVVEFLDSKRRPVTESDRRAGPYPYYGANGLQGTIDDFIFDEPLVLLAEDGGHFGEPDRGIAYRISGKTWVNNHAHVLRPTSDIDLAYLCRVLENYDVTPFVTGTTRGKLTKAGASEIVMPLPPLAEQRRIAELLDRTEALRARRCAALAQLDSLTQSLFLDLFGDPATNPKGVSIESLGNNLLFVTSGGRGWAEFYSPTGSRFIRSLDVQMNHIGSDDVALVAAPNNAEARRTRVKAGDVLLTITGSRIGRVASVPSDLEGSYISQHVAILRVDSKRIEPSFLSFFLSFEAGGQRQIAKAQYGQTKPGLNFEQIKRFQVPVPPIELQREFARQVRAVEKLKTAQRASLEELDALFGSLQHRAFRGEL